jgi:hypothetical protein
MRFLARGRDVRARESFSASRRRGFALVRRECQRGAISDVAGVASWRKKPGARGESASGRLPPTVSHSSTKTFKPHQSM